MPKKKMNGLFRTTILDSIVQKKNSAQMLVPVPGKKKWFVIYPIHDLRPNFSLPPIDGRNSDTGLHSKQALPKSPLPTTLRALHFYCKKGLLSPSFPCRICSTPVQLVLYWCTYPVYMGFTLPIRKCQTNQIITSTSFINHKTQWK